MSKALVLGLVLLAIGGCDGMPTNHTAVPSGVRDRSDYRDVPGPPVGVVLDEPTPTPSPVATPTPVPIMPGIAATEAPEPIQAQEREGDRAPTNTEEGASGDGEGSTPAAGALVEGVTLTVYSCYGDSTGAYCPWGNSMYCGKQVYRGAAACGWQWECGQRFRIIGDPLNMIYTCEDRGGAVTGIDVWFMDYGAEGRAWRNQLSQYVTIELVP